MQVFVAVVDTGSQSAASVQLDLSRPVVSRYLAELEEWVGARLLHRTTRRLSLTPAGADILERCRKMLEFAGDMRGAVHQPQQAPRGLLRITASTSFAQMQLAQLVTDYGVRYPEVAVDMVILDRTVNLIEDRIDLAIRITNRLDPNLIARKLSVCRSVICASPAYLHQHQKPLRVEDLALHNCLTHSYVGKSLWQFTRDGEPSSVAVSGNISANESMVLLHAALAGAGIAFLPTYSAGPLIRSGKLVALLPEYEPSQLDIYGVYASRKHMSAALRSMLDFLVERLTLTPVWDAPE